MSNDMFVKLAGSAVLAQYLTDPRSLSSHTLNSSMLSKHSSCTEGQLNADSTNKVVTHVSGAQLCCTNMEQAHIAHRAPQAVGEALTYSWALKGLTILNKHKVNCVSQNR